MDLELTRIFVKVVQSGSFSKAGEILKIPKSTISKAVSRLERETGTKLLLRTTRSLSLTPSGRAYYDASVGPLLQLEDAQKSLYGQDSILTGLVKLTAPEDLGSFVIAPAIAKLSAQHPGLSFELEYTNHVIDLVKEGYDFAVRLGRINESSFKIKRLGDVVLVPVASPQYLRSQGKIKTPDDLVEHSCLSISTRGMFDRWTLRSSKGTANISIKSKISSNQTTSLVAMAAAGAGIALVPKYLCQPQIESGKLVRVLPEWSSRGVPASIVSPLAPSSSARLKLTIDHVYKVVTEALAAE